MGLCPALEVAVLIEAGILNQVGQVRALGNAGLDGIAVEVLNKQNLGLQLLGCKSLLLHDDRV